MLAEARRSANAQAKLDEFAERMLSEAGIVSPKTLARVLAHDKSPRSAIVDQMTLDLTGGSLQSTEQLLTVCASFAIQDSALTQQMLGLKEAFVARNHIVHEMDLTSGQDRWKRRLRPMASMIGMTDRVLAAGQEIIDRVGEALREQELSTPAP